MTQDASHRPTTRRSTRGRNRPLLVTSTSTASGNEAPKQTTDETVPTLAESTTEVQAQNPPVAPTRRKLPSFFSTVGKNKEDTAQEKDIAQSRIARATRVKAAPAKTTGDSQSEVQNEPKKAPAKTARPATPARPTSTFKTRYIFGMVLYLIIAQLTGSLITWFSQSHPNIDTILAQFQLFGGKVTISISTLVFLAMLVIILVLLARFDLIPRSFGAMSGQQPTPRNRRTGSSSSTSEESRTSPPTMRQGVKGADDDLYREYRSNQRKKK